MTTTTALPLNVQARAMLKELHRQTGVLPQQVDAVVTRHIEQAAQAVGGAVTALDCDALEKILVSAMPDKKQVIENAKGCGNRYHGDTTNGRFLTQILSMRIEKETHNVYLPPAPVAPRTSDPLYASFTLAPDADVMLLFNARDVDAKGQPVLMKVVARERFDMAGFDFGKYRLNANGTQPDVVRVKDTESYVETKDIDEAEFAFGDPLKQISLNNKAQEISTSLWIRPENIHKHLFFRATRDAANRLVLDLARPLIQFDKTTTGDNLDSTPVKSFSDKVRLTLTTDQLPAGAWLDTATATGQVKASLSVDRGFIFEPGSKGTVVLSGGPATGNVRVEVDAADAHLIGNNAKCTDVIIGNGATLRSFMSTQLVETTSAQANGTDTSTAQRQLSTIVFADAAARSVAGEAMRVLGDATLTAAGFAAAKLSCTAKPLPRDPEEDGVTVSLTLHDAFLAAVGTDPVSFKGYTMVAGFTDVDGVWKEQSRSVKTDASCNESFAFECNDFDGLQKKDAKLEIRLFNADGVPAQRVLVPFRQVQWA